MMGRQVAAPELFYDFRLDDHGIHTLSTALCDEGGRL